MSRQAIITRYLGPTNYRPGRVKATAAAGSVTVSWDHSLGIDANHARAAKALADKYGWGGAWMEGGMPLDNGNCYVAVDRDRTMHANAAFETPWIDRAPLSLGAIDAAINKILPKD